jgi:hypothetical protein
MDYKSLTTLMLRLTGVIILASSLFHAPNTFGALILSTARADFDGWNWLLMSISAIVPILIGLLLVYFPATVANRIVSGGGETADPLGLEQIGFSIVGLYFVATAVFDAAYWYAKLRIHLLIFSPDLADRLVRQADGQFASIASTGASSSSPALPCCLADAASPISCTGCGPRLRSPRRSAHARSENDPSGLTGFA